MPGLVEVSRGMTILRRIAATDLATLQAHTKVDPAVSDLEAFLAALGTRLDMFHVILDMGALRCAHESSFPFDDGVLAYKEKPLLLRIRYDQANFGKTWGEPRRDG
jgi:hypothetical protein